MVLPKFLKQEGQPVTNPDKQQPPTLQMVPIRRPRPLSEVAAQAAQHVSDLEQDRDDAIARLNEALNRNHLLEERVQMLTHDLQQMESQRDYHRDRHSQIEASLRNSAAIILDVLREPRPEMDTKIAAVADAVERDLTTINQSSMPTDTPAAG